MTLRDAPQQDDISCPKRLWVMTTLADDEAIDGGQGLPQGLKFHLSRCEPCRLLAEQLQNVTGALGSLGSLEPSKALAEQADVQMRTALRSGALLTGRVVIPDAALPSKPGSKSGPVRFFRYAAAAAVMVAVGLSGVTLLKNASGPTLAGKGQPSPRVIPDRGNDRTTGKLATSARLKSSGESKESAGTSDTQQADDGVPGSEQLAAGKSDRPSPKRRRLCRHHSYVEAAECDGIDCVPTAIILPRPGDRDLGWGKGLFDNSRSALSTGRLRSKNKRRNQD